ncbi:MAG: nucleotide exchange factor GrpE, partial [Ktedonobacterales bacterium]
MTTEEPQQDQPNQHDQPMETPATDAAQADAPTDASTTDAPTVRIAALERELATERELGMDYLRRWKETQADLANLRRRMQQEQEQRDKLLTWNALAPVVTALDSLERAFLSLPPTLRGYSWIDGIALVDLQLRRALEAQDIRPLNAEPGQSFDPQRHQVIGEVETAEHDAGLIAVVVQQGYEAGPMLLRPALVQVARAP